jgi:hypothetical protein
MNLEEQLKSAEIMASTYGSLEQNSTNKEDILRYRKLKNKYSDLADSIYNKLVIKY